jgi:hypothetical protein
MQAIFFFAGLLIFGALARSRATLVFRLAVAAAKRRSGVQPGEVDDGKKAECENDRLENRQGENEPCHKFR